MPLSAPLTSWLLTERSDRLAIDTIRKSPILLAEAQKAVPALRDAALTPATDAQIRTIIGQRFALFPQPERSDGEWAAWWVAYFDALEGLTPFAVEAGMAAWVRSPDAEFMCKPGKLAELARTVPNDNRWAKAHHRAVEATKPAEPADDKAPTPKGDRPSADQVAALMAEFHTKMAEAAERFHGKGAPALKRNQNLRPTPSAQVDHTGISPEARALIEKQQARF